MNNLRKYLVFTLSSVAILLSIASTNAISDVLFSDNFDRPDSADAGNGWGEDSFSNHLADMVSISANRLKILKTPEGFNRDAVVFRPFSQTCGVVVSGTVEWMNANPHSAAQIGLNGLPSWNPDGLIVEMRPWGGGIGPNIAVINHGTTVSSIPFSFDLSLPYQFEWSIQSDCSTEFRLWQGTEMRPNVPTASTPPLTFQNRVNPHLTIGGAGLGSPTYPDWEIRFDNLVVTEEDVVVGRVLKTGQSTCYDNSGTQIPCDETGQDGEYQKGIVDPLSRFTDNLDGTITDNKTGLTWVKQVLCSFPLDWQQALDHANTLADGQCGLSDGSVAGDWRLPNYRELQSLNWQYNVGVNDIGLPISNPFDFVSIGFIWSSTSDFSDPQYAHSLVTNGSSSPVLKTRSDIAGTWAVRDTPPPGC